MGTGDFKSEYKATTGAYKQAIFAATRFTRYMAQKEIQVTHNGTKITIHARAQGIPCSAMLYRKQFRSYSIEHILHNADREAVGPVPQKESCICPRSRRCENECSGE
jgi:hypothetical protein